MTGRITPRLALLLMLDWPLYQRTALLSLGSALTLLVACALVVMTLLSLVVLALGSALRTTAQTEERVDQRLARNDEIRVVTGFLQSAMRPEIAARGAAMTSPYHPPVKRSLSIAGHQTSISLEPLFWDELQRVAAEEGLPVNALVARIDALG